MIEIRYVSEADYGFWSRLDKHISEMLYLYYSSEINRSDQNWNEFAEDLMYKIVLSHKMKY